MQLAVFLNIKCTYYEGNYWAEEAYYQFWLYIARSFSHVYLCLSVKSADKPGLFKIEMDPERVSIIPLPHYQNSQQLYSKLPGYLFKIKKILKPHWEHINFFTAVVPNPIGLYLIHQAQKKGIPCALYIRGNLIQTVRYEYIKSNLKWLSLGIAYFMELLTRRSIKKNLTFVVGRELSQFYKKIELNTIPIVTSLIYKADIVGPKTLNSKKIYHLLHVGRFSKEKGVDILIDAFNLLQKKGIQIHLELVGDGPEKAELQKVASAKQLNITFSGFIPVGNELNQKYRNSDIFVLPSLTEGFPKVLLEAMANGTPIVTTAVGSIPQYMTHEKDCLMVPSNNIEQMADAIERLTLSLSLRESIRNQALLTINNLSIEHSSEIFIKHIHKAVE